MGAVRRFSIHTDGRTYVHGILLVSLLAGASSLSSPLQLLVAFVVSSTAVVPPLGSDRADEELLGPRLQQHRFR
jgi:hypothetical protein